MQLTLNFRKDGSPLLNDTFITPVCSDPARPDVVTYFVAIQRFRPCNISLGPLPIKPADHLPDTLSGESAPVPTPMSWASGGEARDTKDWLGVLGERELCHFLSFLNIKSLAAMACTSRYLHRLVNTDGVWQKACRTLWGARQPGPSLSS